MESSSMFFKKCPYCGENIPVKAGRCPYCCSLVDVQVDPIRMEPVRQMEEFLLSKNEGTNEAREPEGPGKPEETEELKEPEKSEKTEETEPQEKPAEPVETVEPGKPEEPVKEEKPEKTGFENPGEIAETKRIDSVQSPVVRKEFPQGNAGRTGGAGTEAQNVRSFKNSGARLSNALKVALTAIATAIPGIGQLIGIIVAIVFMNSEDHEDKRSFGLALLIASLIMFVLNFLLGCVFAAFINEFMELYGYQ